MEETLVKFGDVFRYRETEYVFLAQTDEVVYAAKILDDEMTGKLQVMSDRLERAPTSARRKNPAYSFVILQTDDFKGRAAHFGRTDNSDHQVSRFEVISSLAKEDCTQIKNEILLEDSAVSLGLIEIVRGLNIA